MRRTGLTLPEILVVVVIISILVSGLVLVGRNVIRTAQVNNTKATMGLLIVALDAYKEYKDRRDGKFIFPVEPKRAAGVDLQVSLDGIFGIGNKEIDVSRSLHGTYVWGQRDPLRGKKLNDYILTMSTSEFFYYCLDEEPASQEILNRINVRFKTNVDKDGVEDTRTGVYKELIEVNDIWGIPIDYQSRSFGNFPVFVSAGPDGIFGGLGNSYGADDIVSNEF